MFKKLLTEIPGAAAAMTLFLANLVLDLFFGDDGRADS